MSAIEPLSAAMAQALIESVVGHHKNSWALLSPITAIRDGDHICLARMTEAQVREACRKHWSDPDRRPADWAVWLAAYRSAGLLKDGP